MEQARMVWRVKFVGANAVRYFAALLWFGVASLGHCQNVVVWNMEWFPGGSPRASIETKQKHMVACQKVLKELNPDIFIAEEIADWTSFQELVAVVPNLQPHVVSSFRDNSGVTRQQVAIASKFPANSAWAENWKHGWAGPPRGYAFTALTLPDGKLLMIYGLHLKSNIARSDIDGEFNIAKREDSIEQLLDHTKSLEKVYGKENIKGWIVGGDFNTNEDDLQFVSENSIRRLEKEGFWNSWTGVLKANRLTWKGTSRFPATTFDFIFLKNLKHTNARLWDRAGSASDHQPVIVDSLL